MEVLEDAIWPIHAEAAHRYRQNTLGDGASSIESYLSLPLGELDRAWATPMYEKWADRGAVPSDHFYEMFSVSREGPPAERTRTTDSLFDEYTNFEFEMGGGDPPDTPFGNYYDAAPGMTLYAEAVLDAVLCAGLGLAMADRTQRRDLIDRLDSIGGSTNRVLNALLIEEYDAETLHAGDYDTQFIDEMENRREELVQLTADRVALPADIPDKATITPVSTPVPDSPTGDGTARVSLAQQQTVFDWLGFGWPYVEGEVIDSGTLDLSDGDTISVTGRMVEDS